MLVLGVLEDAFLESCLAKDALVGLTEYLSSICFQQIDPHKRVAT